ncbi:DUF5403 family protein [Streptomyces albidoflavus]
MAAVMYSNTPKAVAQHQVVQDELTRIQFEIAVRAEEILLAHRVQGHARIEMVEGDVDHYVVLSDDHGQQAALSIEYGRAGYTVQRVTRDGREFEVEIPATEGLYVLARASGLPKKRKGKVKV